MPLDFPLVSDVSLFHLCTKRPSIFHSHSILQTECSTLHKSDCVWQNRVASSRFLHIDFTTINSLCPKHTYILVSVPVLCSLFVDCSYWQKPCSPTAVTEGQVGCVTKSWARSAVWKILKGHQFHPTRAPIDASCPLPQFTFSTDESLQRHDDDTEQLPLLWRCGRLWGNDMMETEVWMVSKCFRPTFS